MSGFTHFDEKGNAVMVDVHEKADTYRVAVAQGTIAVNEEVFQAITNHTAKKGDVLGIARIAGIMGAKKNAELIPLCHIIALTDCENPSDHGNLPDILCGKNRCGDGSYDGSQRGSSDDLRYV